MEEKKEMLKEEEVTKVSGGYNEGDIVHDYCPWCQCDATGVFTKKDPSAIGGYQIKMVYGSCCKTFYHCYA